MRTNADIHSWKICREWKILEHPVLKAMSSSNPPSFLRSSLSLSLNPGLTISTRLTSQWAFAVRLSLPSPSDEVADRLLPPPPPFPCLLGPRPQVLTAAHQALSTLSPFSQPLFSLQIHLWSLTILFDGMSLDGCLPGPSSENFCASRCTCSVNRAKCMFSCL